MTDEQFDERISEAFAEVKLSKEAEDRILANLLAAESQKPDKWTGHLSEKPRKRGRVIRWAGPVAAAAALLVFCLLYTPCVAAIAAIKRELGWKWALGIVAFQCAVAWAVALLVRLVLMAAGVV